MTGQVTCPKLTGWEVDRVEIIITFMGSHCLWMNNTPLTALGLSAHDWTQAFHSPEWPRPQACVGKGRRFKGPRCPNWDGRDWKFKERYRDLEISRCGWEMGTQNLVKRKRKQGFGRPQGKTPGFMSVYKESAKIPSRPCGQSGRVRSPGKRTGRGRRTAGLGDAACGLGERRRTPNLRLPHSVAGLPSGLGLPCCLRS